MEYNETGLLETVSVYNVWFLDRAWKSLVHILKEWKNAMLKNKACASTFPILFLALILLKLVLFLVSYWLILGSVSYRCPR
jgi:hypothetical protein